MRGLSTRGTCGGYDAMGGGPGATRCPGGRNGEIPFGGAH